MSAAVEPSAHPAALGSRQVAREFRRLLASGARIRCAGAARRAPERLLARRYAPKYKIALFETVFYLTDVRQNPDIRFFVAYVVQTNARTGATEIFPRIFYKDVSLVWRSASHFIRSAGENWIGKGELRRVVCEGREIEHSVEETTDLPLELQGALEALSRRPRRIAWDDRALALALRGGPDDRIAPYRDFVEPRVRARANPRNRIHGGRSIARFARRNDPASLRFARGFEPDFERGVVDVGRSHSKLYGGALERFRILSKNREIQYLFIAGPRNAWIIPPQSLSANLTSYGVRAVEVVADELLCIPGLEYHFVDTSGRRPVLVSQIPEGFAGEPSPIDPSRADASRWLEQLPVIREFRRKLLAAHRATSARRSRCRRS